MHDTIHSTSLEDILCNCCEVLDNKTGTLKVTIRIQLKKYATPRFHKAWQVSYALKEWVDKELDRLVQGVYRPVGGSNRSSCKYRW